MKSAMKSSPSELEFRGYNLSQFPAKDTSIQLLEVQRPRLDIIGKLIEVIVVLLVDENRRRSVSHSNANLADS